jgi:hypothetical protein
VRFKGEVGEQATMFFLEPCGNALKFKAFNDPLRLFARRSAATAWRGSYRKGGAFREIIAAAKRHQPQYPEDPCINF